ncbi:hypothetical protein TOPH_08646 [Tolypocladium ophioglossoides CBS 100239]|uniref:Uncharacterized protein n=1 Tax=Tolypocladium ophioglossoides (strain CBS 100239) TaxID=1163406 RepID=A0A0L0MYW7_TOLOC|nr:hypothetical protein TOPH_08646 [Tolypocladium ophioglossoides CBS 100239]
MKFIILGLLAFAALVLSLAAPQLPTPASPPPPLPPPPSGQAPPSTRDAPPPPPDSASQSPAPPAPTVSGGPPGPICECGYTYCASVLLGMKKPWNQKQLAEAYCKTPDAPCALGAPSTNVKSALYLCLCDDANQRVGNQLHLLCGCDKCLVVGPDYRGRCETPCHAGNCK